MDADAESEDTSIKRRFGVLFLGALLITYSLLGFSRISEPKMELELRAVSGNLWFPVLVTVEPGTPATQKSLSITEQMESIVRRKAIEHGFDYRLLYAVVRTESDFNPRAISPKGARGLMQLMPETAKLLGVKDLFDPEQNLDGGCRYLRYLMRQFDGDLDLVLAAYNSGPALVGSLGRVPRIKETKKFVKDVKAAMAGG